jgi:hypothetical protein
MYKKWVDYLKAHYASESVFFYFNKYLVTKLVNCKQSSILTPLKIFSLVFCANEWLSKLL